MTIFACLTTFFHFSTSLLTRYVNLNGKTGCPLAH